MPKPKSKKFILWFSEINVRDVGLVGGKNASLGEMYQSLTLKGKTNSAKAKELMQQWGTIKVPNGFAVTSYAYRHFIKKAGLEKEIRRILKGLNTHDVRDLAKRGAQVRKTILSGEIPEEIKEEIRKDYKKLSREFKMTNVDVAVRSSATAEDLPDASFAGQQETFLNIRGEKDLLVAVKKGMASLFTNRAISYRQDKGFSQFSIALSVSVQKMARSDKGASGVMFTLDTESGFRNAVLVNSIYGLGENIVQGIANPDEYLVFKPTLVAGHQAIISKRLGTKHLRMIYAERGVKNLPVPSKEQLQYAVTDREVEKLAQWGMIIEAHYGKPMDIEWVKDGVDGRLYIVQARPETIHSSKKGFKLEKFSLKRRGKVLVEGISVGQKIATGPVRMIKDTSGIAQFKKGEVLVTEMTDPDWEPIMKIASAIVTDQGGRTSHAAIVSRELGIPAIVGSETATKVLKTGMHVTVSCAEGEKAFVYQGELPFEVKTTNLRNMPDTKTQVMMNVGEPDAAFGLSFLPHEGVGLARQEFIITNSIKIHPLALINFSKLKDKNARRQIEELTKGYKNKAKFYSERLAYGIARLAAAFHPHDVVVRLSDFRSNEYAGLIGGAEFEPEERNPMIGWRGSSRHYSPEYRPAFDIECEAFRRVRDEMGLTNVVVMLPFCRTVDEGKKVLQAMEENGLKRGRNGLRVFVMAEVPSNIILADQFAKIFDGFSIGSNDLTQLTLGVDRDSELVDVFDERNEAVLRSMAQLIQTAHAHKPPRKVGICGDAPSTFPEIGKFLVEHGIDSISVSPDVSVKTRLHIAKVEQGMRSKPKKK